ncbi:hypothetical protein [Ornithinibacillus scapharcae]|uniref:hypothetical protein n=1 Tax=Ornithinibacillus scapharcae TaxID=1147159 RepID=UPI000225BCA6|nr:hypothetical protein [Ornithinibacillus scapharcae]
MHKTMQDFLNSEISDQEYYDGIIRFIYSGNIRCGEYEGNLYIIHKFNLNNFIIYCEYTIDGKKEIHQSFSIQKNKLLRLINDYAKKQGFLIRDYHF